MNFFKHLFGANKKPPLSSIPQKPPTRNLVPAPQGSVCDMCSNEVRYGKAFLPHLIVGHQGRCFWEKRCNGSKCHLNLLDDKTVG